MNPREQSSVSTSPYRALREWWGDDLTEDVIVRLRDAPLEQWIAFSRDYDERKENADLLDSALGRHSDIFCSIGSKPDELYDGNVIPLASARVRALALLVDRVVVADPLETIVKGFLLAQGPDFEPPSHREVEATLRALVEFSALEHAGAVLYRSSTALGDEGFEALRRTISLLGDLRSMDLDWRWASDPRHVLGSASPTLAALNVVTTAIQSRLAAPSGAMLIGTPLERSVLEQLVVLDGGTIPGRAISMQPLGTLAVPTLIPDASTVVYLSRALEAIGGLPDTAESWLEEARMALADEIAPSAARLSRALRRSSVLSGIRRSAAGLAVSALGAIAGGLVGGNPIAGATSAAVTYLSSAFGSYLSARPAVRGRRAVLESYFVFGHPPS